MTALAHLTSADSGITLFVWLARLFLLAVAVVLVGALLWLAWVFPVAVAREALRARRLGDWWAPFRPREDGRYGPLAQNRWWAFFRAPRQHEPNGLAWRWAAWAFIGVTVGVGVLRGWQQAVLLVVDGWS